MTPSPFNVGKATVPEIHFEQTGTSDTKSKKEIHLYIFKIKIKEL